MRAMTMPAGEGAGYKESMTGALLPVEASQQKIHVCTEQQCYTAISMNITLLDLIVSCQMCYLTLFKFLKDQVILKLLIVLSLTVPTFSRLNNFAENAKVLANNHHDKMDAPSIERYD